ncbi:methyl-accepting chemotaxis protein [Rhodoferax sp.]|uniref:methyl-accepting chemotaxis protein n=1 Tax=Rhodoferax sp. TaxID=50421 RepID=UPI00283CF1BF|nr:methyl-accepting chemotaxis protein [Rhodoferax sp.]MDR3369474.1 methyl-accepting chemotaxis protein [Rhodoferax sp.]
MIRHPDMPEEAFRDMWDTIEKGQPWSAAVKNRRKDGSYYWVMANVTPLMDGDKPVAYMSVRTEASRAQIQASEALYATMRAEKESGRLIHTLHRGRVVKHTLVGRMQEVIALRLSGRLNATLGIATGLLLAAGELISTDEIMWELLGSGMATATLVGTSFYLHQSILSPLRDLRDFANRMAAGDLTQHKDVSRNDEMGQLATALFQLTVNLQAVVRDARTQSIHMTSATGEIAAGNVDLSQRTESQASSLAQTAAAIEEITGSVKHSADSAEGASKLADGAAQVTQRGSDAVNLVVQTMQEVRDSSHRILDITGVIEGISFQTNILALNAAVEAARAGDHGRGFAVVASEVRTLSQRTSTAAREIKQLINDAAAKIETGYLQTDSASKTMDESLVAVQKVNQLIAEVSLSAKEQLIAISQINTAVTQMESITQQNAALVEQIAAAASSVQGQAQVMTSTVQVFHLQGDNGFQAPDAVELRRQGKQTASKTLLLTS